jgi:hypothetical protein
MPETIPKPGVFVLSFPELFEFAFVQVSSRCLLLMHTNSGQKGQND